MNSVNPDAPDQAQGDRVYEWGITLLRLAIPTAWGGAVAWGATHGVHIPDVAATALQWGLMVASTAGWYALWHSVEHRLPPWFTRLLLGSNTPPRYPD